MLAAVIAPLRELLRIALASLDPLAVMHIACGPALDFLDLLRVDQKHLEATRLEQLKEWDPIDPVDSIATVVIWHWANQSAKR